MAGGERREDRGLLSAQLLAGIEPGRVAQLRPEAQSDDRRSGTQQTCPDPKRVERPAQHPEITPTRPELFPAERCPLCRISLIDMGRINSFWSMKDRARIVGENGMHPFVSDLQNALPNGRST